MSQTTRKQELPRLRQRYAGRGRKGKSALITEVCEQWGYHRKHAIKLLHAKVGWGGNIQKTKGRSARYGKEVANVLWQSWNVSEQPCGKRLAVVRKLWLPYYEEKYGKLSSSVRADDAL